MDGVVSDGQATITTSGTTLNINQSSDRAVIDWRSFNIDPNETTAFHQPSSSSLTLNRINSADPSQILGTLTANGHIILINPNGVFFGKGSHVDVGGLTATTANIRNSDFMSGNMNFDQPGRDDASIINEGSITVHDGGLVNLVGPNVENHGVITATLGKINMASGEKFTIDMANDGLIKVAVDKDSLPGQVIANTGTLSANGGQVNMTAAAARDIVDSLITNTGVIEAKTIGDHKGSVTLSAVGSNAVAHNITANKKIKQGQSTVVNSGTIDVSGLNAGESGGATNLLADNVWVESGSTINASGANGGGTIKIGGDFHGEGDTPTAAATYVASNTSITADAIDQGDGGDVTIWADGSTNFYGDISAKGGANSGNGGFVEVSGKDYLNYRGQVNTLAENGRTGMLLLDPADIIIKDGSGDGDLNGSTTSFAGAATNGTVSAGNAGPSSIYESELEGIGATTNISVAASNSITINSLSDGNLSLKQTSGNSAAFAAGTGGITMLNTANTITTAGGALSLSTTGAATLGNLTTAGGNLTVGSTGAGVATIGNVSTGNGSASITATGGGTIGNISVGTGGTTVNLGAASTISGVISGTGGLVKTGAGALTLMGANTYSGGTLLSAGSVIANTSTSFGTNTVSLGGVTSIQGNGTGLTFNNSISLNASITIGGSSDLTFSGTVSNTTAAHTLTVNNTGATTFGTINLSNSATSYGLTFTGTGSTVVNGVISNGSTSTAGSIVKAGTGTLTLNGVNTFGGGASLNAGTLIAGNDSAFGTGTLTLKGAVLQGSAARTFANAVSLAAGSSFAGSYNLTFNGDTLGTTGITLINSGTGLVTFGNVGIASAAGNRTLTFDGSGSFLVSGVVSNNASTGSIGKTGTGSLTLAGANTYTNGTSVTGGTLLIGNDAALGTGTLTVGGGTIQGSGGAHTVANAVSMTASSTISGTQDLTLNGAVSLSNAATNYTLVLSGSGNTVFNGIISNGSSTGSNLSVTGSGMVTLAGANTYSGTTTMTGGTVRIANNAALGTSTANLNGSVVQGDGATYTLTNTLSMNADTTFSGGSALTFNGTMTNSNSFTLTNNGGGSLTLGNIALSTNATNRTLTIAGTGTTTISGIVGNGSASSGSGLAKMGTGTLLLSGANTYGGTTTITGGTLQIGNNTALGMGVIALNGGTLQGNGDYTLANVMSLANNSTIAGFSNLVFSGLLTNTNDLTLTNNNGGSTTFGNVALSNSVTNRTLTIAGTGNTTISGAIGNGGGSAASNFVKSGTGTLTLSGNNTYTGTTTAAAGTLKLGASDRISSSSDILVSSGAIFDFNGFNETVRSIVADGDVAFGTGNTITTANAQTYTGKISGGNVSLVSTSGNITATNAQNDITGDLALNASGSVSVVDVNALKLGAVSASTLSVFAKGGNLTLDGNIQATGTSGTPLLLSTTGNFINSGSYTLQTGAGGRWLVYSTSPLTNANGGIAATFKQYNATYGDTVLGSGNGFIYTLAPTVTAGLTGTVTKTYDGTIAATLGAANYTTIGAVDGDTVVLNNPASGTYDTANAGTGKTVTVSGISMTGVTNGATTVYGYQLAASTASAAVGAIDKANVTVTTSNVARDYDGTVSASGTAIVSSGTLYTNASNGNIADSLSGGTFAFANANAGTNKTVNVSGITVNDGNGGNNYNVTQANNTTSTINKAALTVSVGNVTKNYDGSLTAAGTATVTSGTLYTNASNGSAQDSLSGGTFAFANANAGTNKTVNVSGITVNDGNGGNNYTVTQANNASSTINKATITVSTSDVVKNYDGTLTAAGTATVTSGTLYTNASNGSAQDSLSGGTFAFANANAGTNKTVNVSGITVNDGNGGNNYTVTQANNTSSTIHKAAITVSTSDVTKNYDGSLTAAGVATVASGMLYTNASNGGAQDGLSGGTFAFTNANAGTNKTVNVSGISINDGNGGNNYTVTQANNTTSTINKAAIIVSTSDVTKDYDGSLAAAGTAAVTSGMLYTNASNGGTLDSLNGGTFSFTNANAGINKAVIVSGVTANDGNGGNNYTITYANNVTSIINKAAITLSTASITKPYDGNTIANGSPVVTSGSLYTNASNGNIADSLSGGSYAFVTPEAGIGKVVLVGSIAVSDGNGGHNYNVTYANNTNSMITSAAPVQVITTQTVSDVIASVTYARSPFILPQADKITAKNAPVLNTAVAIAPVTSVFEVQPTISYDQNSVSSSGTATPSAPLATPPSDDCHLKSTGC